MRQRLLGSVRLSLVAALLGALLVATAGVVSAAAAITASPGSATASGVGGNTFFIPYTTIAADLDVDCGASTAQCSVYVARNNAAKATEALFTNVTGSRSTIPVGFINDGCFNFRVYDSAHGTLLAPQVNIGHGTGAAQVSVCKTDGTGQPVAVIDGGVSTTETFQSGPGPFPSGPGTAPSNPLTIDWDSGFANGVDDAQLWIGQSTPGFAFTDCSAISYPNASEVLYAQNVSGEKTDLNPLGGGPYCFTLYQGTGHATKIGATGSYTLINYLAYAGGTPNPGFFNAGGTIYFNSGNGATNALVCVYGTSTGGTVTSQTPFAFNSLGYGSKVATFQTANGGHTANAYELHVGVTGLVNGAPTAASCLTGTSLHSFGFAT